MTPADRERTLAWARGELAMVDLILRAHQQRHTSAVCVCGRPWECSIHGRWSAYRAYVSARLALAEGTEVLPVITTQTPRALGHPAASAGARVGGGEAGRGLSPRRRRLRPSWFSRWR